MMFRQSKNQVFGGGLYLRCIAVIFAFIQCCYAETIIDTPEKFQHFVYEAGWRANAKNCSARDKDKWYNDKIYEDSIYKIIPQAIADCMQKKAEFENVGTIVTFEANDHTGYSPENWNAVVLWNYLEYAIHKHGALSNDGVPEVGEKLKTHYAQDYWEYINKAVSDIQAYAKDLNLYDYIKEIKENTKNNKYYEITKEFDTSNKNAKVTIRVCNKTIYIQNSIVSEHNNWAKTVPTSADEVHALPNFAGIYNDDGVDISAKKCWFNSVMLNLYNSKTIHKVINNLQEKTHDKTMPSYWIKQIFNDIRSGNMTKYGTHLKGWDNARKILRQPKEGTNESCDNKYISLNSNTRLGPDVFISIIYQDLMEEANTEEDKDKIEGALYVHINYIEGHDKCQDSYNMTECMIIVNGGNESGSDRSLNETMTRYTKIRDRKAAECELCHKYVESFMKTQILSLPTLLVFADAQVTECPETLHLQDEYGTWEYKLIGVADDVPGYQPIEHVCAKMRLNGNQWIKVDELDSKKVEANTKFEKSYAQNRYAFYERIS